MVVYLDLTFLVNLLVDSMLLWLTSYLLRLRARPSRIGLAASLGSLYSVLSLFPWGTELNAAWCKTVFSVLFLAFLQPRGSFQLGRLRYGGSLARTLAVFYLTAFCLAGAVYGSYSFFGKTSVMPGLELVRGRIAWWTSIPAWLTVALAPIVLFSVRYATSTVKRRQQMNRETVRVTITVHEQSVEALCLVDTGNALIDPITHAPVAVVTAQSIKSLLPPWLCEVAARGEDPVKALYKAPIGLGEGNMHFTMVPYRGIGAEQGMLLAFRPTDVTYQARQGNMSLMPLVIALRIQPMSDKDHYDGILPATAFGERSAQHEHSHPRPNADAPLRPSHPA